jgi:murein L,D-transpeptidase YafK
VVAVVKGRNVQKMRLTTPAHLLALVLGITAFESSAHAKGARPGPMIVIDTQTQTLSVLRGDRLLARFENIAIGRGGLAADRTRGDGTTPVGTFRIDRIHPNSRFRLFFGIDFPRPEHARRALEDGRIQVTDYERIMAAFDANRRPPQDTALGGHLGIHGLGPGDAKVHELLNWTQGCIALTNQQIEQLSRWIRLGMRVEVR